MIVDTRYCSAPLKYFASKTKTLNYAPDFSLFTYNSLIYYPSFIHLGNLLAFKMLTYANLSQDVKLLIASLVYFLPNHTSPSEHDNVIE